MRKQSLIKGTLILGLAGIFAKFLGIFFRWPLIMLIGDKGIGYYQMSYPLYTFFVAAASGIPLAISKLVAERNAAMDRAGIIQVLNSALLLMIILGGGFSAVLIIFSRQLIQFFNWDAKAYYSLMGISMAPIIISIMNSFRGFFQGLQNMMPTAVSQIIEQIGRVCIGVGLAYLFLPRGIEVSAGGAAFGAAAGGFMAGIYLIYKYIRVRKEFIVRRYTKNTDIMYRLLRIAIPMSLGATVSSIMGLIDVLLVPRKLLEAGISQDEVIALFGQLTGKAGTLVSVPLTLSMALCMSLVPIIAESHFLGRTIDVHSKVDTAIRISTVVAFPCTLGLYFMARPILQLIFPGQSDGYLILQVLSLSVPFIILTQASTYILQGVGEDIRPVINLGLACIVKVIITYILVPIPYINIYGAALSSLGAYIVAASLNMHLLKKTFNVKINYYEIVIKPAFAAVLMIIAVVFIYLNVYNYTVSVRISSLLAIAAGALIYVLLIVGFGTFKYSYIKKRFLKR
ncbi:polysaccharide biosynthesis protein [Clostridium sp. SYSU_GA19001]|uniref:putative polysaccharide biosynthesis protein n=1 Tax=Clostridium caldaquaticum TaxID=2940653 RepID=UPI002076DF64|nr:polysaccharide biosynthesis protein [Clostridium caldaquaticum]MCM8709568.1 polysaccharide biosynthesis protein [Clostridium caldaquaticum]